MVLCWYWDSVMLDTNPSFFAILFLDQEPSFGWIVHSIYLSLLIFSLSVSSNLLQAFPLSLSGISSQNTYMQTGIKSKRHPQFLIPCPSCEVTHTINSTNYSKSRCSFLECWLRGSIRVWTDTKRGIFKIFINNFPLTHTKTLCFSLSLSVCVSVLSLFSPKYPISQSLYSLNLPNNRISSLPSLSMISMKIKMGWGKRRDSDRSRTETGLGIGSLSWGERVQFYRTWRETQSWPPTFNSTISLIPNPLSTSLQCLFVCHVWDMILFLENRLIYLISRSQILFLF